MAASLLGIIAWIFLPLSAIGLEFNVQPTKLEIGLSKQFNLVCSFNHGSDPEMSSLISLFISRSKDTTHVDFQELASVNTFSGNVSHMVQGNATISGVINNLGMSFLSMEWKFPGDEVSGLYRCDANGVDGTGHPVSVVSSSLVTSEIPDTSQLVQAFRSLMMNMDYALDNTCISGCWQSRLDKMMKARFEISSRYNGHKYLLSKIGNLASAAVAQESCELYGGYLAEIDDGDELLLVQNFIKSPRNMDYRLVLIGGTDEGHEHNWVFDRSGRNVTYTKWIPGYPKTDTTHNCLYLHGDHNWTMIDYLCFETVRNFNSRYMCELPEQ